MTLSQTRAAQRFACIQAESTSYSFHVKLSPEGYLGLSEITFTLVDVPTELHLDLSTKQLKILVINGNVVQKINHSQGFLFLNVELLVKGVNTVAVQYSNKYDNDGNGCINFVDVDKKQYLYTQFEPYSANRVFALFDQPDLKAQMELSIILPTSWENVLSNEYPVIEADFNEEVFLSKVSTSHKDLLTKFVTNSSGKMYIFPKTKLLPTYLYCFVAGPYKRLQYKDTYKNIPMSLYCIESLYLYLEKMAPFVFEVTVECMKFFESFFGVDYPFNKYDQVFAHEYKMGAMQNAGIVTFNDEYIWKEQTSTQTMLDLANTISHELSHHWFGNLSTMKWWDDLWLNESFAQFISHLSLEKIQKNMKTINYESPMSAFLARKAWGYHEDQMITTHPIAGQVRNTKVAMSIFDGITYSKGAATMKQLLLLIGEQNFSKGLSSFFKKYGFKNATLADFINELSTFFTCEGLSLPEWQKLWLETASLNILSPEWNPNDNTDNAVLKIIQTPFTNQYPVLRPHKIKIALFKQDKSFDVLEVMVKAEETTLVSYKGSSNYKAVLLNYQDHTFAKIIIDQASINFFSLGNLTKIEDILTRTMIWRNFFDLVKDGVISSVRYIDIFQNNIANQKSDSIFERHFQYIHTSINRYTPEKYRDELNGRIFYFILSLIQKIDLKEQNRLVILKNQLTDFAQTFISIKILLAWREQKYAPLLNHKITTIQKWKAVVQAFTLRQLSNEEKKALLQSQLKIDSSDTGKLFEAKLNSLIADENKFKELYQSFKDPANEQSVTLKHQIISGWNHPYHSKLLTSTYKQQYFSDLVPLSLKLEADHFELFLEEALPIDDNLQETINGLKSIKYDADEKYDKIRRDTQKIISDLERRLNAYKKFEQFSLI